MTLVQRFGPWPDNIPFVEVKVRPNQPIDIIIRSGDNNLNGDEGYGNQTYIDLVNPLVYDKLKDKFLMGAFLLIIFWALSSCILHCFFKRERKESSYLVEDKINIDAYSSISAMRFRLFKIICIQFNPLFNLLCVKNKYLDRSLRNHLI